MTLLLYIPVALKISYVYKFTLLTGHLVSQFSSEYIDDFLGRGGVVIQVAGIDALHVSI